MSLLSELDGLDRERPDEPFTVRAAGQSFTFRDARELSWRDLVDGLNNFAGFLTWIGPGDDASFEVLGDIPVWKMQAVVRAYRKHYGLPATPAEDQRLVHLVGTAAYRKAIEWDLHALHRIDLTSEWQARRWRRLVDFIDALPNHSHFAEAMADDEELAEEIVKRDDGKKHLPKRRISEFTPEVEVLSTLADRMAELINVNVASRGGKPRKVPPAPRPVTAVQKVKRRRAAKRHEWTVARVYGRIGPEVKPPD